MNVRTSSAVLTLLVASAASTASAQSPWHADLKPTLDISSSAASGSVLFARVTGATRLGDGTIVVADGDDNALHYFSAEGKPLRTAGRTGTGPGEFRHLTWLGRCGSDSLHVWDMVLGRMAVYAANGAFVRQYTIPADTVRALKPQMTLACSSHGTLAWQGQIGFPKTRTAPKDPTHPTREERVISTTAPVAIGNSIGTVSRQLGERSSGAMYLMGGGGFPLPLGVATYVAVAGDRVFAGTADSTGTISAYMPDGAMSIISLHLRPRPTTADIRLRAAVATASIAPQQLRTLAEDSLKVSPMPANLPPYSGLFGDADGILWVQLTVPGEPATRLRAIGTRNETVGEITLPPNVVIQEIGHDYILGAFDDADDVPHLAIFRLHRTK
jgi:hypothetical protein